MGLPRKVYLKLILDIDNALEKEDQKNIKFLSRAYLKDELAEVDNFKDLILKLEKEVINENKLDELERLLNEINRPDLAEMVQKTIEEYSSETASHASCHSTSISSQQIPPLGNPHYLSRPQSNNSSTLESVGLEVDSTFETDCTSTNIDLKSLALKPYQNEVAQRALNQNTLIFLPVNAEKEKVAVYVWKKVFKDLPIQTLIIASEMNSKSFQRVFKSERDFVNYVQICTPKGLQHGHAAFETFDFIIIDECDFLIEEIADLNSFLKELKTTNVNIPRLLGFCSDAHIKVEKVEPLCELLSATVVSYVQSSTTHLTTYCHPPDKDVILKSSQTINGIEIKLTTKLKTEFTGNPHSKGIIITKSDEDTNKVYSVISNSKDLTSAKFKVLPQKLLSSSLSQRILNGFNAGNFNVLIATDCLLDCDVQLPDNCKFLIRYNFVVEKMKSVQRAARSLEGCTKCFLIIYRDSEEWRLENKYREHLKKLYAAFDSFNSTHS